MSFSNFIKLFSISILLTILGATNINASEIKLKSGQIVTGEINTQTDEIIEIDTEIGVRVTYFIEEVESVDGAALDLGIIELEEFQKIISEDNPAPGEILKGDSSALDETAPLSEQERISKQVNTFQGSVATWQTEISDDNGFFKRQFHRLDQATDEAINQGKESFKNRFPAASNYLIGLKKQIETLLIRLEPPNLKLTTFALFYIAVCYPFMVIAIRLNLSGIGAWIPILQVLLFVKMAHKSLVYLLYLMIPIFNIFIFMMMWMDIFHQMKKPSWLGIFMIVPGLNLILLWYLALVK